MQWTERGNANGIWHVCIRRTHSGEIVLEIWGLCAQLGYEINLFPCETDIWLTLSNRSTFQ